MSGHQANLQKQMKESKLKKWLWIEFWKDIVICCQGAYPLIKCEDLEGGTQNEGDNGVAADQNVLNDLLN